MIKLDDIQAFKISSDVSTALWNIVSKWNIFAKKTVGDQLIRSVDSIAANIAEAEGRHFKKEKMKFYYYARGSVYESAYWVEKSYQRKLLTKSEYDTIIAELRKLPKQVNYLIKHASVKLKK